MADYAAAEAGSSAMLTDNVVEIPLRNADESLVVDFNDSCAESSLVNGLADVLEAERAAPSYWTRSVGEYWKRGKREWASELAERGLSGPSLAPPGRRRRALKSTGQPSES